MPANQTLLRRTRYLMSKHHPRRRLREAEKVRLFFAAKPGISDLEAAKLSGVPEDLVWSFRDPNSRIPYKRQLLRRVVNRVQHDEIARYFFPGRTIKPVDITNHVCLSCQRPSISWGKDRKGNPRRYCRKCRISVTIRVIEIKPIARLKKESLRIFLDKIAGGSPLRTAYDEARICKKSGELITNTILFVYGGLSQSDWRKDHKTRAQERIV